MDLFGDHLVQVWGPGGLVPQALTGALQAAVTLLAAALVLLLAGRAAQQRGHAPVAAAALAPKQLAGVHLSPRRDVPPPWQDVLATCLPSRAPPPDPSHRPGPSRLLPGILPPQ